MCGELIRWKMNKLSQLTVVVPVYNAEDYLAQCIESIQKQSYQNLEIILVDDGSSDNSGRICDNYAESDNRIRVIHKRNEGLLNARRDGVEAANSEYVTFVDADDWVSLETYEYSMNEVLESDLDVFAFGCIRYWDEQDYVTDVCSRYSEGIYYKSDLEQTIYPTMLFDNRIGGWSLDPSLCMKIFRKDLLQSQYDILKDTKLYYGEDVVVIYPLMLSCNVVEVSHKLFYYHRQKAKGSISPYFASDNFFDGLYTIYHYLDEVFCGEKYYENLKKQLDGYFMTNVNHKRPFIIPSTLTSEDSVRYLFPFDKIKHASKIAIYGAGKVGRDYVRQIEALDFCEIVCWIDKNSENENIVRPINVNDGYDFEYLIIANAKRDVRDEIQLELVDAGVPIEKIVNSDIVLL